MANQPSKKATKSLTPPCIGQAWPEQGGVYAGIVRDGNRQWHLILAIAPESKLVSEWGEFGKTISGEFSRHDGQQNTLLIFAAEPQNKIVRHVCQLQIEGHNDFYFPAQFENNLLCINLPEHLDKKWHWSSTQYSANDAWIQDFEGGYQLIHLKYGSYAVRAVRRLPIE